MTQAVFKKIYVYKKNASAWDTTAFDLSPYTYDPEVNKAIGNQKDTFSFKINNPDFVFSVIPFTLEYGDLVRIWMKAGDASFSTDDLVMEGVIRGTPVDYASSGRVLSVKGNDFFEECFDVQVPAGYLDKKYFEMLQDLLEKEPFKARGLYWDSTNPTTKSDGTDFPVKDFTVDYTPFYQIVEKLTSNQYTEDGQYLYYITTDGTNRYLTIRNKQETTTVGELKEGIGTRRITIDKVKDKVRNYVVFFAGNDLYGNVIRNFEADHDSIGKIGFKYYYMTEETSNIATNIMYDEALEDERQGGGNFNFSNGEWTSSDHFPTSFVSPYTWKKFKLSGATVSSTSASDFNDDLRDIAKEQARQQARKLIENSKIPPYEGKIIYKFRNDLTLGGLYQINIPSRGINRQLRIKSLNHKINSTEVEFTEDETRSTL